MISPNYLANRELLKIPGTKINNIGFKINNMIPVVVDSPAFLEYKSLTEIDKYALRFIAMDILQQIERKILHENTIIFEQLNSNIEISGNRRYVKCCYNDYCIHSIYLTPTNNIVATIFRWDENNEAGMRAAGITENDVAHILIG